MSDKHQMGLLFRVMSWPFCVCPQQKLWPVAWLNSRPVFTAVGFKARKSLIKVLWIFHFISVSSLTVWLKGVSHNSSFRVKNTFNERLKKIKWSNMPLVVLFIHCDSYLSSLPYGAINEPVVDCFGKMEKFISGWDVGSNVCASNLLLNSPRGYFKTRKCWGELEGLVLLLTRFVYLQARWVQFPWQ